MAAKDRNPGRWVLPGELGGATLAAAVRALQAGTSWSGARELCRRGRVTVDGRVVTDPAVRLIAGQEIGLADAPARPQGPPSHGVAIVHADRAVVVVDKPPGVLTAAPGDNRQTLLGLARAALRRRERSRGFPVLHVVHRLDAEASGLVAFARTVAAQRELQQQFRARTIRRTYLALAHGALSEATFDTLLLRDRGDGLRGSRNAATRARGNPPATARRAITRVEPVEPLAGATLVRCRLATGRQHQIRIHLAEAGHPLLGERVYIRDFQGPFLAAPRLMLHAAELRFRHPATGKPVRFAAGLPPDFARLLAELALPDAGMPTA